MVFTSSKGASFKRQFSDAKGDFMKSIVGLVLWLLSTLCSAQQPEALDGNWIKHSIDAYHRAYVSRNGTSQDISDSLVFMSFVSGMLAVHRQNNLTASLLSYGLTQQKGKVGAAAGAEIDKQLRVAFVFTPLLALPEQLSPQQIVAILRRYMDTNPEKWGSGAPLLITEALQQAFARK